VPQQLLLPAASPDDERGVALARVHQLCLCV
jgi:hypothetical protein